MPGTLGQTFRSAITDTGARLGTITEDCAQRPYPGGKWLRKEVLGHLLDSAANNQLRFTCAALNGSYSGSEYDGEGWVRLNGYTELPYATLLRHWRLRNEQLANLVERIPDTALAAICRIGNNEPVTLQFLIEDYLAHLEHHVKQITA